jgi:hypothetical protein
VSMGEVDRTPERGSQQQGELIVRANVIGTVIFVATAVFAAAAFTATAQWVGASTAMVLFAVGVFAFLWGFWNAVQRSRDEEVSVTQLYILLGSGTPKEVRRTMLLMLLIQAVAALSTAIWRIDGPDGSPGSSLAVGLLVPMFGLGLNGLWASYHAEFGKRMDPEAVAARAKKEQERVDSDADVNTSTTSIDQNEAHG